jgi:hypothetical protein
MIVKAPLDSKLKSPEAKFTLNCYHSCPRRRYDTHVVDGSRVARVSHYDCRAVGGGARNARHISSTVTTEGT